MPSSSILAGSTPSAAKYATWVGSASVISSGASSWMYSQPRPASSSASSRMIRAASANMSNGSRYAAVECSGDQK
jgi:hypothetical protein